MENERCDSIIGVGIGYLDPFSACTHLSAKHIFQRACRICMTCEMSIGRLRNVFGLLQKGICSDVQANWTVLGPVAV